MRHMSYGVVLALVAGCGADAPQLDDSIGDFGAETLSEAQNEPPSADEPEVADEPREEPSAQAPEPSDDPAEALQDVPFLDRECTVGLYKTDCPTVPREGGRTWARFCFDRERPEPAPTYGFCTMWCDQEPSFHGPNPEAEAACEAMGGRCVPLDEGPIEGDDGWRSLFPDGSERIVRYYCSPF